MQSTESQDYDVLVIGGGPAGSTCATLLADQGHRVLVLERARFPRHHIGESLMPQTYWTLKRLGVLEAMGKSACPRKESVQFVSSSGRESQPFFFTDRDPNEWSITWQVRRDEFDAMLLNNSRTHGADVLEGVGVRDVIFDGRRAVGVRSTANGSVKEYSAKVVVDASGMSAVLSRQLDLRYPDEFLRSASIYAYYRGGKRDTGRNAGATIIVHTPDRRGWFWFIPLADDMTSVGVVGPSSHLCTGRGDSPDVTLDEELAACPAAAARLQGAERVGRTYVTSDFSYRSRRVAGDGWVLIGDAFGFLDPIYSSGVMLALKSGEMAADTIHAGLEAGDVSAKRLGRFGPELAQGVQRIRQLIYAFYDRDFSFAAFTRDHPDETDRLVRVLIGDVFTDEVDPLFRLLGEQVKLPPPIELETDTGELCEN